MRGKPEAAADSRLERMQRGHPPIMDTHPSLRDFAAGEFYGKVDVQELS
jgi:hypothetical protein